ncbi:MAG: hydrogen gas-evolving membrane-bound hydrogenase subunit E [Candidatus Ratteibacteria bacterium]
MVINIGFHIFILLMMIIGSIVAVFSKKLISSLVSLGTVGMLLSIYFLILGAPDIAITQLVVEILALIILLSAITGRDVTADMTSTRVYILFFIFIFLISIFTFVSSSYFIFPEFGNSNMRVGEKYLYLAPTKLKAANVVTSIVLDFRGYDTIGEATVIFTAIIGVMVLLRKKGKKDE